MYDKIIPILGNLIISLMTTLWLIIGAWIVSGAEPVVGFTYGPVAISAVAMYALSATLRADVDRRGS